MPSNRNQIPISERQKVARSAASGDRSTLLVSGDDAVGARELVQALHSAFGIHRARAVHAKGIVLEGAFAPTPEARSLSRASLFNGAPMPITVRFSDFTGLPDISDTNAAASPRGLAIKFRPEGGADMDVVAHSFNGFPTATSAEFAELLGAIGVSGPASKKPTALERFLADHPIAATLLSSQKPPPVSFATLTYFGVNAFEFADALGRVEHVRYRFVPEAGEQFLDAAALALKGPNYLAEEMVRRLVSGPVCFDWHAQLSKPGDVVDDPSIAWPETRRLVRLGTIAVDRMVLDQASADRTLKMMPADLPDGIAAADPMLALRNDAYSISFRERQ